MKKRNAYLASQHQRRAAWELSAYFLLSARYKRKVEFLNRIRLLRRQTDFAFSMLLLFVDGKKFLLRIVMQHVLEKMKNRKRRGREADPMLVFR